MPNINIIHLALELWGIVFCIIEAICVISGAKTDKRKRDVLFCLIICNALLLLCDSLAWCFRGVPTALGLVMTRLGNFGVFVLCNTMVIVIAELIKILLGNEYKKTERNIIAAVKIISLIGIILTVISQFTNLLYYFDENNFYHRTSLHFLCPIIILSSLAGCIYIAVKRKNQLGCFKAMSVYIMLPAALLFIYGPSVGNIAATVAVMLFFATYMIERSEELQKKQEEILKQRLEIEEAKTMLLTEVIKPHFINNSLAAISGLCCEDPKKASEMIIKLSKFLHTGMSIIDSGSLISFERETELLDNYLYIEQQRFPDKIFVHKDIAASNFYLPPLTVQTLVENAVRHGIRKKAEAGNIYISSKETNNEYIVCVEDDGAGFDTAASSDGKPHIGIENVKKRLEFTVKGRLEIESTVGRGTKATIYIPKNARKKNEVSDS